MLSKTGKERQALLTALLDTAIDAVVVIDDQAVVLLVNPGATKMFGYQADEIIGNNVSMLMPSPYREEHNGYLSRYLTTGEKRIIGTGREVPGLRKNGTQFPMHLSVSEMNVGGRRLFAGIIRDISELKEAERKLAEANQALEQRVENRTELLRATQAELVRTEKLATLGQVSGGIAHEIRNPLNAVKTSVYYLMHAPKLSSEKVKEHLDRIDRQVTLVDNVITALSDVARLPEPQLQSVEVADVIREALADISSAGNVRVENALTADLPPVHADANQVPIVFRNLFRNAVDAMPEGGVIAIDADIAETEVVVRVRDTGIGIPEDQLTQITEPLYSTKARGMGLGLAISKTIVDRNGGRLEAESVLGQGTTFSVGLKRSDIGKPCCKSRAATESS